MYNYYSSVTQQEVQWLWYPYIPYGKITLLQGDPGEGKSTLALNIAALLTRGDSMPDGFRKDFTESVVYQCSEDNLADTIKPRLLAAGADCGKSLTLEDRRIEETILQTKAGLFILDPIQSFISQDGDMQNAVKMRATLGKLARVAARTSCAILLIGHMNKTRTGKSLYRGLGSIDIAAIARSVLMVIRDPEDNELRYMVSIKSSLAPEGEPIGFRFDRRKGFVWVGKCSGLSDPDELGRQYLSGKKVDARDELRSLLSKGPVPSTEVFGQMAAMDVSERTLYKIKKELQVKSFKIRNIWFWELSDRGDVE